VIQEQNSVPGKVNRVFGKRAALICAAFPGMERYFPSEKIVLTGNPVRQSIRNVKSLHESSCLHFGLDVQKPVLLAIGGSQGARSINEAMASALPTLVARGIQVIWQTGQTYHPVAEKLISDLGISGVVAMKFIPAMELAYGAATLVVSRAGALSIAEITLAGLPSVLVPFPFAAADHQTGNAQTMVAQGASVLLKDHEVRGELLNVVIDLFSNPSQLERMSAKATGMAAANADLYIAKLIRDIAQKIPVGRYTPDKGFGQLQKVYFLGIGGIGMSALARWFMLMGRKVHGYDKTKTPLTAALEKEGAVIHYDDRPDLIPADTGLVILTPAIPAQLKERRSVLDLGVPVLKRAELLGMISRSITTIAIAGTHGKTSTSAITVHLLHAAGIPVTGFVGGITKNFGNNFVWHHNSRVMVVEADEFDRSFLHLSPDFSVITSTDADHLDIYGKHERLLEAFARFGNMNGVGPLFTGPGVQVKFQKQSTPYHAGVSTSEWYAENIRPEGVATRFDLRLGDLYLKDVLLGVPGRHNVENAVAASAAALWAGASPDQLRIGLASYAGVLRRFDIRIHRDDLLYIDDYAHHPSELNACISAVRSITSGKTITGIFQPHLYTRTRDFASGFAESLSQLDHVVLLDIYPAREEPIPGVDAAMILEKISNPSKVLIHMDEVKEYLKNHPPEVLLTLGAGDIDTLVPRIEALYRKEVRP
jgi:UDP-N-acetylmuramate--alanine ligase